MASKSNDRHMEMLAAIGSFLRALRLAALGRNFGYRLATTRGLQRASLAAFQVGLDFRRRFTLFEKTTFMFASTVTQHRIVFGLQRSHTHPLTAESAALPRARARQLQASGRVS
jgi:hypothetical protein